MLFFVNGFIVDPKHTPKYVGLVEKDTIYAIPSHSHTNFNQNDTKQRFDT